MATSTIQSWRKATHSSPSKNFKNRRSSVIKKKVVFENCIAVSQPLFDNPTYNKHNRLRRECEDLWNEGRNLSEILDNNENYQSRCSNCMQRGLNIEYIFDENGVLKRMVNDVIPVKELKARLWDPKFHSSFMAARDKQSLPVFDKYTLDDEECVVEPADEKSSESSDNESKEEAPNDSDKLIEQNERDVRDGAKCESSNDVDKVAAELSDKFAPLTLISTDEKTQE